MREIRNRALTIVICMAVSAFAGYVIANAIVKAVKP